MVMECRLPWKCSKYMDRSVKAAITEMAIKGVMEREHIPTGSLHKGEIYSVSKIEWDGIRLYCTQISV